MEGIKGIKIEERVCSPCSGVSTISLQFERSWQPGRSRQIERLLDENNQEIREELLRRLLEIDISLGLENRCLLSLEEYTARFPQDRALVESIYEEVTNYSFMVNRLRIGRVVGNYRLIEQIGKGGMGIVYKGYDGELKRTVAIKYLGTKIHRDEAKLRHYREEMGLFGQLPFQENIVHTYAREYDQGTPYLVMEYIEGEDLTNLVRKETAMGGWKKNRGITTELACTIILQAARGLHHIHQHGMVHRDIKPGNIILDEEGRARICDLETLAEAKTGMKPGPDTIDNDFFVGTPGFVAPEVVENHLHYDRRSDIYSLTCTLFYLLAGESPKDFLERCPQGLSGDKKGEFILRHWFRARGQKLPNDLLYILARGMATLPEERFQDTDQFLKALSPLITKEKKHFHSFAKWVASLLIILLTACTVVALQRIPWQSIFIPIEKTPPIEIARSISPIEVNPPIDAGTEVGAPVEVGDTVENSGQNESGAPTLNQDTLNQETEQEMVPGNIEEIAEIEEKEEVPTNPGSSPAEEQNTTINSRDTIQPKNDFWFRITQKGRGMLCPASDQKGAGNMRSNSGVGNTSGVHRSEHGGKCPIPLAFGRNPHGIGDRERILAGQGAVREGG